MRLVAGVLSVVALAFMLACGDADSGPSGPGEQPTDYLPVSVGSHWEYAANGMQVGAARDTTDITGWMNRHVVADTTLLSGLQVFQAEITGELVYITRRPVDTLTVAISDTIWVHLSDTTATLYTGFADTTADTLLLFPVTVGDTWISDEFRTRSMLVTSLDEIVEAPLDSYEGCALVHETTIVPTPEFWDYYYADGTGEVQKVIHYVTEDLTGDLTWQITNYSTGR